MAKIILAAAIAALGWYYRDELKQQLWDWAFKIRAESLGAGLRLLCHAAKGLDRRDLGGKGPDLSGAAAPAELSQGMAGYTGADTQGGARIRCSPREHTEAVGDQHRRRDGTGAGNDQTMNSASLSCGIT